MIRVNNQDISEADIASEMQYHQAENKRAAQVKAAESLIIGELFAQRARAIGLAWPQGKVNPSEEDKILARLIDKEVNIPRATDEECRHYFVSNRIKFHGTPIIEARHILLAAAPDDTEERDQMSDLAIRLIERIQAYPKCFDDLVQSHSACPSKAQGGHLGQISKGQTVPEFERILMAADEGLISYPIESRYGFHITHVDRKVPGKALEFEQVQDKIEQYLAEKVRRKAVSQYITTLINEAKIEGFDFNVSDEPLMQ